MADAIKKFWDWFNHHNTSYIFIDDVDEDVKELLLNDLLNHLHKYCNNLYFQVGGMCGKEQELIITAEGDIDFFEQVEALVYSAPVIDNWTIIAFIQPMDDLQTTHFEDVELKLAEMWFLPLNSARKPTSIGIKVCTPNYSLVKESKWFASGVYKVLDTILGEKSFALDIDHIDFGELPDEPADHGMIKLAELSRYVKWKKSKNATS